MGPPLRRTIFSKAVGRQSAQQLKTRSNGARPYGGQLMLPRLMAQSKEKKPHDNN